MADGKMKSAYFKYITALILFGLNGIVASHISLSSYEIVFTRALIGSLFLVLIFAFSKQKVKFWENKLHFLFLLISGIAMGTSWMFLYEAYVQIGVSIATLVYYCGPVIVMILSPLVFREKMTSSRLVGFFAVIMGMICVNGQDSSEGGFSWGLICGLLSAFMYGFMVIFNKKAQNITGLENPMWQLIISFLTVAIFVGLKQGFFINHIQENLIPILVLGILNTGIGCYFYFSSIGNLSGQTVAICGYLEPLSTLFFSAILLGENLRPQQLIGAFLILGGAAFGELFSRRRKMGTVPQKINPLI